MGIGDWGLGIGDWGLGWRERHRDDGPDLQGDEAAPAVVPGRPRVDRAVRRD